MKSQRKLGAVLSYVYILVNTLMTFIYTPFLIKYLGKSEYGLYTISLSIMSYLSMLDLGFGNSLVRYISKFKALNNKEEENKINGLFLVFYLIIGAIALLIGFVLYKNVGLLFGSKFTGAELHSIKIIITILIINIAISFPLSVFGSYVIASEKFAFQKILLIIKAILYPICLLYILFNGTNAIMVVLLMSIFNLLLNIGNLYYSLVHLDMHFKINKSCFKYFKEIFSYSFFIFLAIIVDNVYNNTDQIILGAICGTAVVAVYGLFTQVRVLYEQMSTAISGVCLPKVVTMIEQKNSDKEVSNYFNNVSKIQMVIMILILFGFIILGKPFVTLWGGKDYINAYYIALIILIPSTIPLTQNIAISIIQAKNKHQFRSIIYLIIALLNIAISIPLAKAYGGVGAAIGSALALLLGNILIINWYYYKKVNIDVITYWKNLFEIVLVTGLYSLLFKGCLLLLNVKVTGWIALLLAAIIFTIGYLIIIYLFFLNHNDKKALKDFIKNTIYERVSKLFPKNIIIFESSPDMSDNSYALYKYMLKQKINNKYKLVWFVNNPNEFKQIKEHNVKFVKIYGLKSLYYNYRAKLIFDCNKYVYKKHNHQARIHLMHGIGFKKVDGYLNQCGKVDYFVLPGHFFNDYLSLGYKASKEQFLDFGYSRNDILFENINVKKKLGLDAKSKLVLWLPTYRKHKNNEVNIDDVIIPIYNTVDKLKKLNEELVKRNIYIYVKPHPAQDLSALEQTDLSNFKIIMDQDLTKMNLTLYGFLSGTDSLITDYSSVYFDYLLTKNIIGVTLDDFKDYKSSMFIKDYDKIIGGEHIYNNKDFLNYLDLVKSGKYEKKKYNTELKKYHTYTDNKSTERLYDFIKENYMR